MENKINRLQKQIQALEEQDIVIRDNIINSQSKQIKRLIKRNKSLRKNLQLCEYCDHHGHTRSKCEEFIRDATASH
jgi:hypothetical protein